MRGFTLIEFLIYLAIVGGILALAGGFLWNMSFGNIKESSYQEVQQNARYALSKVTQETKKSISINSPIAGSTSSSLSLEMEAPSLNPTVFDVVGGKLRMTQGINSYYLTSDQVILSSLVFNNLSYADTPGTIRVEMTIDHLNPINRNEYAATINVKSTVSLLAGGAAGIFPYLRQLNYRFRNDDGSE